MRLHCFAWIMLMGLLLLHKAPCFGEGPGLQDLEPLLGQEGNRGMPKPWESELNRRVLFYKPFPQASNWRTLSAGNASSWQEGAGGNVQKLSDEIARYAGKGTGFYRTEYYRGRWWFIDASGKLFLSAGVGELRPRVDDDEFKKQFRDEQHWAELESARLKEWGFNTAGHGSDVELLRRDPASLAYTVTRWPAWENEMGPLAAFCESKGMALSQKRGPRRTDPVMPVFHPDFEPFVEKHAATLTRYANDGNLVGYFLDKDLPYPKLKTYLAISASELHRGAREAAVDWLKNHGKKSEEYTADDEEQWAGYVYSQYCAKIVPAIRRNDPNHLVLGPLLSSKSMQNAAVMGAVGKLCDVVSLVPKGKPVPTSTELELWSRWAGRPVLIGQFSAELPPVNPPLQEQARGWIVPSQSHKGRYYETFVLECLKSRACVGWHWQQYQDYGAAPKVKPGSYRAYSAIPSAVAELSNGLVAKTFEPRSQCVERMQIANSLMYAIAASSLPPAPGWAGMNWMVLVIMALLGAACVACRWLRRRVGSVRD